MTRSMDAFDQRARRTRDAILHAFVQLLFDRRYEAIRVTDLIAAAGVGRATFYEHFRTKDDVLLAAMEPLLQALANAALGRASEAWLRSSLDHIWQQRATGRIVFGSHAATKLQRRLAAIIDTRLRQRGSAAAQTHLIATAAAAAQLAMLRSWLNGDAICSVEVMARRMSEVARLLQ